MLEYRSMKDVISLKELHDEFHLTKEEFVLHETYLIVELIESNQTTVKILKLYSFFKMFRILINEVLD